MTKRFSPGMLLDECVWFLGNDCAIRYVPLLRDKSRSFPPKGEKNAFGVLPTQPRAIHPQAKAWGFLAHTMLKKIMMPWSESPLVLYSLEAIQMFYFEFV